MNTERPKGRLPGGRDALELWGGLALVLIGFAAIGLGWVRAADTPDVRVQLQALISGGLGGLGLVVAGGFLVQIALTDAGFRRLEQQLDKVTGALLDLAGSSRRRAVDGRPAADERALWGPPTDHATEEDATAITSQWVLASSASYHLPGCDLLEGRSDVRPMTVEQAGNEDLAACRVCVREPVA